MRLKNVRRVRKQRDWEEWIAEVRVGDVPDHTRRTLTTGIELVRKYDLPCDIEIRDLPPGMLAAHIWRKDESCAIAISTRLNFKGDNRAIHRRLIHEAAHHLSGRGHGHDETFRRVASALYEREGYPTGERGDGWGNM